MINFSTWQWQCHCMWFSYTLYLHRWDWKAWKRNWSALYQYELNIPHCVPWYWDLLRYFICSSTNCSQLTCHKEREYSTHPPKDLPEIFSHSWAINMASLVSKGSPKEMIPNCLIKLMVKIVVCLVSTCWLASHSLSLKIYQQLQHAVWKIWYLNSQSQS